MNNSLCENATYIQKGMTQGIWCNKANSWCGHCYMCTAQRKVLHTVGAQNCPLRKEAKKD